MLFISVIFLIFILNDQFFIYIAFCVSGETFRDVGNSVFNHFMTSASAPSNGAAAGPVSASGSYVVYSPTESVNELEYLAPGLPVQHRYAERVEPSLAKLLYFFIQAPAPDVPAGIIVRIAPTLQESLERVRKVK